MSELFLPKSNLVTGKAPYFKEGHDLKLGEAKVSINMLLEVCKRPRNCRTAFSENIASQGRSKPNLKFEF